jgi:DNA-binding response OmpR family regulator
MSLALPFLVTPRVDVLIVDDNPFMRAAVTRILQRQGRQCVAVASLAAAKMTLLEHPPLLVVTDYVLSDRETGVDLVRWMRSQPTLERTACGLMSGSDPRQIEDAVRDAGLGTLPLLQKPFGLAELETWVDDLMAPTRNRARNDVS